MSEQVKNENLQNGEFEFKAEMKQLLNLIIHSLYTNPEVFLRELVSNSSDALNKIRFKKLTDNNVLDADKELKISISLNKETQEIVIEDTGIGMSKEELINQLGTIAKSGTLEFINQLKQNKENNDGQMIGQFGVGFYSVFMVTDEVTVETRNSDLDGKAWLWKSNGEDKFTIAESDKATRGTKISFKLKDEYKEFAEEWKIKDVLKKYSNFVEFDVYLNDEKANKVTAIWQKSKDSLANEEIVEFYKFITHDYQEPMAHLHLNIEGTVNFKSLLFIPATAPNNMFSQEFDKGLHLYTNRVFIQEDSKNLLPDYLKFVRGVVDTEDLPLNVSREVTQSSPVMTKIKNILTTRILNFLDDLSQNEKDKYKLFYKNFGSLFKSGINADFVNKEKIVNLLRFETTHSADGEEISLADYVKNLKEDQTEIYYITAANKELALKNPNLEVFKKKDIEVLVLTDPMDIFIIPFIDEFDGKKLKSIEKAELKNNENEVEENKETTDKLIAKFKEIIGDKVEDIVSSKRLVESPVTLVAGKMGMDAQMERMMMMMDKDFSGSKKILEINTDHKLIQNIAKMITDGASEEKVQKAVSQLYDGALLLDGNMKNPSDFMARMYEFMELATV